MSTSFKIDGYQMFAAPQSKEQVVFDVLTHIQKTGLPISAWYVGIAARPIIRLFIDHRVENANTTDYIYCRCVSSMEARDAERQLLELGADGGPGGGDESTTTIYAYRKTSKTIP